MTASMRPRRVSETQFGDTRRTPGWLHCELANRYASGGFDLDVAADEDSSVAPEWYDGRQRGSGLTHEWRGCCFANPPWSVIAPWVNKAITEVDCGRASVVVMVLPARTGTAWFAQCREKAELILFLRGRPQFDRPDGEKNSSCPEDVCVVVFRKPIVVAELRQPRRRSRDV